MTSYGSAPLQPGNSISRLSDVRSADGAAVGQVLTYIGGGQWAPQAATGAETLAELNDVTIGGLLDGDILSYNAVGPVSRWINIRNPKELALLTDDVDVTTAPLANGQVLTWNTTDGKWKNEAAGAQVPTSYVSLSDVAVAPTPIAGAVTLWDAATSKWVQSAAIKHNAAGDDKIALETAGAIAINSSGGSVGIQALGGELALAAAGDASLTSSLGNTNVTSLTNSVQITSGIDTTIEAGGSISLSTTGTGTLMLQSNEILSNGATNVTLEASLIASFIGQDETRIGIENGNSVTNVRGDEINVIMSQQGVAFIPDAFSASIITIEDTNKSAAQYALDIASTPSAVPNVQFVLDTVSGDNSQDVRVGGQAPASTLSFGTTNVQEISLVQDSQPVLFTSSLPDKTTLQSTTGEVNVLANSSVTVSSANGSTTIAGDAGVLLSTPDQITLTSPYTQINGTGGAQRFAFFGDGQLKSLTPAYETLVTTDNNIPNKKYVDTGLSTKVAKAGDTMTGALAMGVNKVTSSYVPTVNDDVTNKLYIDTRFNAYTFSPSIEPETISTQAQALGKQGPVALARYWSIDTTYTLNSFVAGRKNLAANSWAGAFRNKATGELIFIQATKVAGTGTVSMSTLGVVSILVDGTQANVSLWYNNALTLPVINRGSSSVNSVSDDLDTVLNVKFVATAGAYRVNTRDIVSIGQTDVVGTGISVLVNTVVGYDDPTVLFGVIGGNSASVRAMMRFSGGQNITRISVSNGVTLTFDDTTEYYPEYYILKSTITNNTFAPTQVTYNMTALTNVSFVNATDFTSFATPITIFTQAQVDDRLIFVKITNPSTSRYYRFDGNMSNAVTTALTPYSYTIGIGAGQVRPAPYLLPKVFANMIGNTTSSGGTLDVVNWIQGPLAVTYSSAFTLTANNTFTFSSLFPDYNPQTFEITYAGYCTTPSNDRSVVLSAYKNPSAITSPLVAGLIPTSTLTVAARPIDSPSFSSGSFTVSLTSGDVVRFYCTNVENGDIVTVPDFKIVIRAVVD